YGDVAFAHNARDSPMVRRVAGNPPQLAAWRAPKPLINWLRLKRIANHDDIAPQFAANHAALSAERYLYLVRRDGDLTLAKVSVQFEDLNGLGARVQRVG